MIDFGKIQADAVKNICKSKITGKAANYRIYSAITIDGNTYIPLVYKEISIYLIPEKCCLLNSLHLQKADNLVKKIFKSAEDAEQLTDTKVIKLLPDGRRLKEFETKANKLIFIDKKLIKPFGQDIGYYANENSDIVYIKSAEEFLGLVLVTRVYE